MKAKGQCYFLTLMPIFDINPQFSVFQQSQTSLDLYSLACLKTDPCFLLNDWDMPSESFNYYDRYDPSHKTSTLAQTISI